MSDYRSQKKQDQERALGSGRAARTGQHTVGRAADIKIPGLSKKEVGNAAYDLGRFERVNVHPAAGAAVHVDYLDVDPGTQMYDNWMKADGQ